MTRNTSKPDPSADTSTASDPPLSAAIKDSAQQIWLAGLGAFAKAQAEGSKAFETLVREGLTIQKKTQTVAEERMAEASNRVNSLANEMSTKATGQWDKLENLFEERVAKALRKLGVPSAREVDALTARIDELSRQIQNLQPSPTKPRAPRKTAAPSAPRKTASRSRKAD
jgi:poly(hydroxyalkanoate) granule-associated protein